jgi:hypothetical protein
VSHPHPATPGQHTATNSAITQAAGDEPVPAGGWFQPYLVAGKPCGVFGWLPAGRLLLAFNNPYSAVIDHL